MARRYRQYKITVLILSFIIAIETAFIVYLVLRPKKILPVAIKGKIAICIDDWGYNLHNLAILDKIRYPLTLAILPNLNYSQSLAKIGRRRGFEVILHLPMEPEEKLRLEKNTILTSMEETRIKEILMEDLVNVLYAKGVSNHMGSRATQDPRIMAIIFKELKKRKLYFLDSLVSKKSVCADLARKMHLKFAQRDVFLDNVEDQAYIKEQLNKLKTRAGMFGQAIGIGHDLKVTLETLKEVMPKIEKEGYKFVFVSELTR
ncbi:MAG: divergent polysaccharide deacetylase family protein [Candidatus Omnitrophica bacterium]|nr:divergent polysaccharide deacetylase family protein [Candidatus Omnitrophota bacterium]